MSQNIIILSFGCGNLLTVYMRNNTIKFYKWGLSLYILEKFYHNIIFKHILDHVIRQVCNLGQSCVSEDVDFGFQLSPGKIWLYPVATLLLVPDRGESCFTVRDWMWYNVMRIWDANIFGSSLTQHQHNFNKEAALKTWIQCRRLGTSLVRPSIDLLEMAVVGVNDTSDLK